MLLRIANRAQREFEEIKNPDISVFRRVAKGWTNGEQFSCRNTDWLGKGPRQGSSLAEKQYNACHSMS